MSLVFLILPWFSEYFLCVNFYVLIETLSFLAHFEIWIFSLRMILPPPPPLSPSKLSVLQNDQKPYIMLYIYIYIYIYIFIYVHYIYIYLLYYVYIYLLYLYL